MTSSLTWGGLPHAGPCLMQAACPVTLLPLLHHAAGSVQAAGAGGGAASHQGAEAGTAARDMNATLEGWGKGW